MKGQSMEKMVNREILENQQYMKEVAKDVLYIWYSPMGAASRTR
jgi:hypothetical protein